MEQQENNKETVPQSATAATMADVGTTIQFPYDLWLLLKGDAAIKRSSMRAVIIQRLRDTFEERTQE